MTVTSLSGIKQNVTWLLTKKHQKSIIYSTQGGSLSSNERLSRDSLFEVFYGFLVWEKDEKRYAKNEVAVF